MKENWKQWLMLLGRPAFAVEAGRIRFLNEEAMDLGLTRDVPLEALMETAWEDYETMEDGWMYLPLTLGGATVWASTQVMDGVRLFLLERTQEERELKALALAAQSLRVPLSNVMTVADRLLPRFSRQTDAGTDAQLAELNRGLYQILRAVSNMSDAGADNAPRMERTELGAFLYDLYLRGSQLLEVAGLTLHYDEPSKPVMAYVDRQLLERAVYNLMSNSAKYAKRGGQLWLRLETQGGRIRVILQDDGEGVSEGVRGTLFDRYRRDPGLGDSRWGIGLGMQIVLKAARIHGGTLLMRQIAEGGTEMVLSLNPGQPEAGVVRTPMLYLDYAGARDHALIELADVLPGMVYSVDNIN